MVHSARFRLSALLITLLPLAGCSRPAVKGQVMDGFGNPLPGASVSVENTTFSSTTDSGGHYALEYVPGKLVVHITKNGYTKQSFALDIATKSVYPAQTVTLHKIPSGAGVYAVGSSDYTALAKGTCVRYQPQTAWNAPPAAATYSVQGEYVSIPSASELSFVDTDGRESLKLYRVQQNGIILVYYEAWGGGSSTSDSVIISERITSIAPGLKLRTATLGPGRYAFAARWSFSGKYEQAHLFEVVAGAASTAASVRDLPSSVNAPREHTDEMQAARSTMRDIRMIATAVEAYAIDFNRYPPAGSNETSELTPGCGSTLSTTSAYLSPTYIRQVPMADGWNSWFIYASNEKGTAYQIQSAGKGGRLQTSPAIGETSDPSADLIYMNGKFLQWPKDPQR